MQNGLVVRRLHPDQGPGLSGQCRPGHSITQSLRCFVRHRIHREHGRRPRVCTFSFWRLLSIQLLNGKASTNALVEEYQDLSGLPSHGGPGLSLPLLTTFFLHNTYKSRKVVYVPDQLHYSLMCYSNT